MPKVDEAKIIELWEGFEVVVNEQMMDDFDFVTDLQDALSKNDLKTLVTMYMALIGGDEVYQQIREHIEKDSGYFSQKELLKLLAKIDDALPKSRNRAQRRSWKTTA